VTPRARSLGGTAERADPSAVATFADTAAFSVVVSAAVAVPLIFSIAVDDVFALPKTVMAVSMAGLVAVLLTVRWAASGRPLPSATALTVALLAFVVWNLLAAWFAVDPWHALVGEKYQYQGLGATLSYAVFLVGGWATVRSDWRQGVVLTGVAVGAVIVVGYALIQRAGLDPIWSTLPDDRVFSTIGQANALAAYLVLSLPLLVPIAVGRRWPWALTFSCVMFLSLAALAFTLSRGGFLGLAAAGITLAAAAWLGRHGPVLTRRRIAIVGLVAVAIVGVVLAVAPVRDVAARVATRALLTADLSEGSTRMHLDQWAVGAAIIADHPLLGTGQDTYVLTFDAYRDNVLPPDRAHLLSMFRPESPHNVYLATAAGAGVPTLVAYLGLIGVAVVRAIRAAASTTLTRTRVFYCSCLAAIAGHLVTDMFLTAETSASVLFWIVLGAAAAAGRVRTIQPPAVLARP
jgi:O-antigen ligase